jgi:hypothetical protein
MPEFSPQFEEFFNSSNSPLKRAVDRRVRENNVQLHLTVPFYSEGLGKSTPSNFIVARKTLPNGVVQNVGSVGFSSEGTVHGLVVHPALGTAEKGTITMAMLKAAHTLASKTKLFGKLDLKPHKFTSTQGLGVANRIVPGAEETKPENRVAGSWDQSRQLAFLQKFKPSDFVCAGCFSTGVDHTTKEKCTNCRGSGMEPSNAKLTLNKYLGIER